MGSLTSGLRAGAVGAAVLALLAACDRPKPRHHALDQPGPLPVGGQATPASPAAPAEPPRQSTTAGPLPAQPLWAEPLIGKALKAALPSLEGKCIGNTDVVDMRYTGATPGVKIEGWAWDVAHKAAVEHVLLADDAGKIVGAAETGVARPDVVAARREVTSPTSGWRGVAASTGGKISAYGVVTPGKVGCPLGEIGL